METGAGRRPTRDYRAYSSGPWPLFDTIYSRKSQRKYLDVDLDEETVSGLTDVASMAESANGAREGSLKVLTDAGKVRAVKAACHKGLTSKINVWLARAPVAGFLILDVPRGDVSASRPVELPHTVMAAEDVVLWLSEQGIGSCWLGGVNSEEIIKGAELGVASAVPAVISFGRPAGRSSLASYSGMTEMTMSRRRKTMGEIARVETCDVPYEPGELSAGTFRAAAEGVRELIEALRGNVVSPIDVPAPIDTALEACLEAARVAPSGGNGQAWMFVLVRDRRRLGMLARACGPGGRTVADCQAAIVALGSMRKFETMLLDKPFWMLDVPIAMGHISLMAASAGYPPVIAIDGIDESEIGKIVKAPASARTVGVIGL